MAASAETTTIVLVGRTGNGKSSTGNTILGKSVFRADFGASAVTSVCQIESAAVGQSRRIVRVIDTPGLDEASQPQEGVRDEILKCLSLASEGVHAVLLVLSAKNRFTVEEARAVESLRYLFGEKVMDYTIVLFTGGDKLQKQGATLEEHTSRATGPLKALLSRCDGRVVLFDNKLKTGDRGRRDRQVAELLRAVDAVVGRNGGRPYTEDLAEEAAALRRAAVHVPGETSSEGATLGLRVDLERDAEKLHAMMAEFEEWLARRELERPLELQREEGTMQSLHDAERRRAEEEAKNRLEQALGTTKSVVSIVGESIPILKSLPELVEWMRTLVAIFLPQGSGTVAPPVALGLSQSRMPGLAMKVALHLEDPQAWKAQVDTARLVMDPLRSALGLQR